MKIRLKALIAGPRGVFSPGAVVDFPDAEAAALIEASVAERVEGPAPAPKAVAIETTAVEPDSERAVMPPARPRRQTEDPDPDKDARRK